MGVCCSSRRRHTPLQATLNEMESDSDKDDVKQTDDDNIVAISMQNELLTPSTTSLTPSSSSINSSNSSLSKYFKSLTKSTETTANKIKKKASKRIERLKILNSTETFPQILLSQWIIQEGVVLNDILDQIYNNEATSFFIPEEITQTIVLYTIDLLPGIYEFEGRMNYSDSVSLSRGNYCCCQIILNSRSEIVGGYFSENSFKYHITNGSYTLDIPHCIEFTKEYFNRNYKYKVYGQLFDIKEEKKTDNHENGEDEDLELQFRGKWKMDNGARGGSIIMNYVGNKKYKSKTHKNAKKRRNNRLIAGNYTFYGYCDYLPNIKNELEFFYRRQRVECKLRLNKIDLSVDGMIRFLLREYNIVGNDDGDGDKFIVVQQESEWDQYGGLHVVLQNGYKMDGFFNGNDFMGVWKDEMDARFGHFHFQKIFYSKNEIDGDDETDCEETESESEKDEDEDGVISSKFLLERAKTLDSDEDDK